MPRRLEKALNAHDVEAVVDCFAENYVCEFPLHPARNFIGNAQVRANWSAIFARLPDLRARLMSHSVDGDTVWTDWEIHGTGADGVAQAMAGVAIFYVVNDRAASARFYLDSVDRSIGSTQTNGAIQRGSNAATGRMTTKDGAQAIAWLGGSIHHILLDASATEGRLSVFRSSMRNGAASPVHIHDKEDETIHVLSGTAIFWAGSDRWELGPGDTVFLPLRLPHAYIITSEVTEIITVCNPAGTEELFRSVGWDLAKPMPNGWHVDMSALASACRATGQRVLGPPLTAGDAMPQAYLERAET